MKSLARLIGGLGALLLFAASCQTAPEEIPAHFRQETLAPEFLHARLFERQNRVHDLKAFVKTQVSTPRRDQSFRQILLLQGGDRLRLDTLSPFNQPLSIFILRGTTLLLFDLQKNRLYTGLDVWSMMYELLGTVIDFGEYVPVFSGGVPRLEHLTWQTAQLDADKTHYVLTAIDPQRRESLRLRLDARTLLPATLHKWALGRPLYSVAWDHYETVGDHPFPHQVTVARAAQQDQVTLEYSDPAINQGIDPEVFTPRLPGLTPAPAAQGSAP